jgi:hypothetical protein
LPHLPDGQPWPVKQHAQRQREELDDGEQRAQFDEVGMSEITIAVTKNLHGRLVGEQLAT